MKLTYTELVLLLDTIDSRLDTMNKKEWSIDDIRQVREIRHQVQLQKDATLPWE